MKATVIILTFLTITFVLAAIMISAAKNAPDNSISYTPKETSAQPRFEVVTEKKSIWELMKKDDDTETTNVSEIPDDLSETEEAEVSEQKKRPGFKEKNEAPVTTVADPSDNNGDAAVSTKKEMKKFQPSK